jgi:Flp pilus assembly protein TadD
VAPPDRPAGATRRPAVTANRGDGARRARDWVPWALVAAVAVVYAQTAHHGFVALDDPTYIVDNPPVARGLSWPGLLWAFTRFHAGNWHPLTWLSHMLDATLFGVTDRSAGAHHLISAGFHAAGAVLLYQALRVATGERWPSAMVAALFAVHPLRVESVAWASERKDVLSGCCFMLALWFHLRPGVRGRFVRPGVIVSAVAGLLAKPMLVTLPFVLLALDLWPLGRWSGAARRRGPGGPAAPPRTSRELVIEKAPLLLASLLTGVVAIASQRSAGAVAALGGVSWPWRIVNGLLSCAIYPIKTVWPSHLACFYPHPATLRPLTAELIPAGASALTVALVTVATWRARHSRPYLLTGWLWYLVMLLPVAGLFQVGDQGWADRYAYLPTAGLGLMVAWGARDLLVPRPQLRTAAAAASGVAVAALAAAAFIQVGVWRDSGTLFRHALAVTRDNWYVENALGAWLLDQGALLEARRHLEASLRVAPRYPQAQNNLCSELMHEGAPEAAEPHCELALELRPDFPEASNNLGLLLLRRGRWDEARAQFERALRAVPDFPEAHSNLAMVLLHEGRWEEARAHCVRSLALRPRSPETHFNLALVYEAQGRASEAAREFEQVLALEPDDAETHRRLAALLLRLGRDSEARRHLDAAERLAPAAPESGAGR